MTYSIKCPHCHQFISPTKNHSCGLFCIPDSSPQNPNQFINDKTIPTSLELIHWQDRFDIGINIIDNEHRFLINIINEVHASLKSENRPPHFIKNLILKFKKFSREHFTHEESLFMPTEYPEKASHLEQHKIFIRHIEKLQKAYETTFISLRPTLKFLVAWFIKHTQEVDRQYIPYLPEEIFEDNT